MREATHLPRLSVCHRLGRRLLAVLAVVGLLWAGPASGLPAEALESSGSPVAFGSVPERDAGMLRHELLQILGEKPLRRLHVGVIVRDVFTGRELFGHNGDQAFNPASNTKLLTTAAALSYLGAGYRYQTVLLAGGPPVQSGDAAPLGTVKGDVFLQGSADPTLMPAALGELVARLRKAGVQRIEGNLLLDGAVRSLDELTQEVQAKSHGPGALILNQNRVTVWVSPSGVGERAAVSVTPRSRFFALHSSVKTVKGKRSRVLVDCSMQAGRMVVSVRGRIGVKSKRARVRRKLGGTQAWVIATLQEALADHGITLTGEVRVGPPPVGPLTPLARYESETLGEISRVVNKNSDNFVADEVFKTLGGVRYGLPGTLEKGSQAVGAWMEEQGLAKARFFLRNGSGLTYENRLRPGDLATILQRIYHSLDVGPDLLGSLAVGGVDGTIAHRFHGKSVGLVRAKTGTLNGVTVLSGYVGQGSETLLFCVFMEGFRGRKLAQLRHAQERVVETLLRFARNGQPPSKTSGALSGASKEGGTVGEAGVPPPASVPAAILDDEVGEGGEGE